MVYAMLYAENVDVVGTYDSFQTAARDLAEFAAANPDLQHEIGLRPYLAGVPAGRFIPLREVLAHAAARHP
jgi:hypothetical protein